MFGLLGPAVVDTVMKYMIVSNAGTAKSNIMHQVTGGRYIQPVYSAMEGTDFADTAREYLSPFGDFLVFDIMDTPGNRRYRSRGDYLPRPNRHVQVIVFSKEDNTQLGDLNQWIMQADRLYHVAPSNIIKVLMVDKSSIPQEDWRTTMRQTRWFAKKNKIMYWELFTDSPTDVKRSFQMLNQRLALMRYR